MVITSTQDTASVNFEKELVENFPPNLQKHFGNLGGRTKWGDKQRKGLLKMFWISFGHFRGHSDDEHKGYFGSADSFSQDFLRKNISNKHDIYLMAVCPYYDSSEKWSRDTYTTKKWYLKKEVEIALIKTFASDRALTVTPSLRMSLPIGKYFPKDSKIQVPSLIPINIENLDKRILQLDDFLKIYDNNKMVGVLANGNPKDIARERNRLLILRKTSVSMTPKFNVPNLYKRGEGGRLYGNHVNLQFVQKETRLDLLKGNEYFDYDFALCHPTIVFQLLQHFSQPSPYLESYLKNRKDVVTRLMALAKLNEDEIKEILTLLVYDSNTVFEGRQTAKVCRQKERRLDDLNADEFFNKLKEEYKKARTFLIKQFTKNEVMESPTGKTIGLRIPIGDKGKTKARSAASQLSFILQSIEAEMLEIACAPFTDTVLLCFDGWISPKRDRQKVEETVSAGITAKTGISFKMKIKETAIG